LELNSTFRESAKRSSQSLISHPANKFNVLFVRTCLKYWSGTKLIFSGENRTHFYKLIQQKKVNWKILKLGSLSLNRFDFYYFKKINKKINDSDESSVKYFLQDCVKNLEEKRKDLRKIFPIVCLLERKGVGIYYGLEVVKVRSIFEFIKKEMD